jgi:hypothetical protein
VKNQKERMVLWESEKEWNKEGMCRLKRKQKKSDQRWRINCGGCCFEGFFVDSVFQENKNKTKSSTHPFTSL